MIKYKKGSLIDATEKIIGHGCNALGIMGAGVAFHIAENFPLAKKKYIEKHKKEGLRLGETQFIKCGEKIIANLITQAGIGYGLQVSYHAIELCMIELKKYCLEANITSVALPKIGSGLGGGSWPKIEQIIENTFRNTNIQVVVYVL